MDRRLARGLDLAEAAAARPLAPRAGGLAPRLRRHAAPARAPAPSFDRGGATRHAGERRAPASKEAARGTSIFGEARLGKAIDAEACLPLVHEIVGSVFRNPARCSSLARLKTQDDYPYMHSVAVCALMVALGRARWGAMGTSAAAPASPVCCTTWARR